MRPAWWWWRSSLVQPEGDKWRENIIHMYSMLVMRRFFNNNLISGKQKTCVCLNNERTQMRWTRFSVNKFFFCRLIASHCHSRQPCRNKRDRACFSAQKRHNLFEDQNKGNRNNMKRRKIHRDFLFRFFSLK
jgi:hypothetical protein